MTAPPGLIAVPAGETVFTDAALALSTTCGSAPPRTLGKAALAMCANATQGRTIKPGLIQPNSGFSTI